MDNEPGMNRYRHFRRASGVYYIQDNRTNKQESLRTRDPKAAKRAALHRNESANIATGHRQIAIGYARRAQVTVPALEDYEKEFAATKVVLFAPYVAGAQPREQMSAV